MTANVEQAVSAMLEPDAVRLLAEHGIPYPEHRYVRRADEVAEAAEALGYPVVVKVVSPDIIHKSDVGGVAIGITGRAGLCTALERMDRSLAAARPGARREGCLVCRQIEGGHEVVVGGLRDEAFGPVVMFGMGGIYAELMADVSFRVAPLAPRDAREMLGEIRAAPLLRGARGRPPMDVEAIVGILMGVSRLMEERPEILELDLNPVLALPEGAVALDARVVVDASL